MTSIVHLSDLHFGRDQEELLIPLVEAVNGIGADLVVVSGDFTQRARVHQFEEARDFLDRIEAPTLSVPGNHDTPLDNLFVRMFQPWKRYRDAIDRNLEPTMDVPDARVVGVNTVNRFSWQRGRVAGRTIKRVCGAFSDAGDRLRVAVLHHPLEHGPEVEKRLMRGAVPALSAFQDCGADVVLSGHLHHTITQPFAEAEGLLFVQAGTGLSNRLRGEANTFNLLTGDRERVEICTYAAEGDPVFRPQMTARFCRDGGIWRAEAD